jgi:DNA primase
MEDVLDELYEHLDHATRYERYIASLCPFHSDTRPSFFVYPNSYYCASCGAKGDTKKLLDDLRKKQGVYVVKPSIDFHSPWQSWLRVCGNLESVIERTHKNLIQHNKTIYLRQRGLTMETIRELKLGWLDDWITFPIYDINGKLVGATARAGETNHTEAKYCNVPKQSPDLLYVPSWQRINDARTIYLVFGILDIITLHQLGFAGASTTTGKRTNSEPFDAIRKKIVIIPDKGEELQAFILANKLGWRGEVMRFKWPDGTKDVNNVFCHCGTEKLLELIGV